MHQEQAKLKVVKNYDINSYPSEVTVETMDGSYTFTLTEMRLKDIKRDQKNNQVRVFGTVSKEIARKRLSILADGLLTPLFVDSTSYLIEGYTRDPALRGLGWTWVPVYMLVDARPAGAKLKRLQVTLNKVKGSIQGNSEPDILEVGKASLLEDWQCLSDEKKVENVTTLVNDSLPQNTTVSRRRLIRQIFNEVGKGPTLLKVNGYAMTDAQQWLIERDFPEFKTFIKNGKFNNVKYCRETNSIPCVFPAKLAAKTFGLLLTTLIELESGTSKIPQKDLENVTVHFVGFSDKKNPTDILDQRDEYVELLKRYIDSSLHIFSRRNFEVIKFIPQIMEGPKKENQHSLISYPFVDKGDTDSDG